MVFCFSMLSIGNAAECSGRASKSLIKRKPSVLERLAKDTKTQVMADPDVLECMICLQDAKSLPKSNKLMFTSCCSQPWCQKDKTDYIKTYEAKKLEAACPNCRRPIE